MNEQLRIIILDLNESSKEDIQVEIGIDVSSGLVLCCKRRWSLKDIFGRSFTQIVRLEKEKDLKEEMYKN